jgi:hypothetical protein
MSGWARRVAEGLLAGAMTTVTATFALAQNKPGLQALLNAHRCAVVERLKIIHATFAPKDRYLVLSVSGDPQAYVQCLFLPDKRNVLCEASSGYYRSKVEPQVWTLHPDRQAQLARLGFGTGVSRGNFQRKLDFGADPDFERIADLMVSALHHGYGADLDTSVRVEAPLLPLDHGVDESCGKRGTAQ